MNQSIKQIQMKAIDQVNLAMEFQIFAGNRLYTKQLCYHLVLERVAKIGLLARRKTLSGVLNNLLQELTYLFINLECAKELRWLHYDMKNRVTKFENIDKTILPKIYESQYFKNILATTTLKFKELKQQISKSFAKLKKLKANDIPFQGLDGQAIQKVLSEGIERLKENSKHIETCFKKIFIKCWKTVKRNFRSNPAAFKQDLYFTLTAMVHYVMDKAKAKNFQTYIHECLGTTEKDTFDFQEFEQRARDLQLQSLHKLVNIFSIDFEAGVINAIL